MRQLLKSSKVSSTERLSYFTCAHVTSLRRGFRNYAEAKRKGREGRPTEAGKSFATFPDVHRAL